MKFGLVELHVDVAGIPAKRAVDAVRTAIYRDEECRAARARRSVELAKDRRCDFILLPGWSLVADTVPEWLIEMSEGCTIVAECLFPKRPNRGLVPTAPEGIPGRTAALLAWACHVLNNGVDLLRPARQHISRAKELWEGNDLSRLGSALAEELQTNRRWTLAGIGEAMLVICGEANFVGGGGKGKRCRHLPEIEAGGLTEAGLRQVRLVVNPGHTAGEPQAMRDKRKWLSQGGMLVHTANIHSGGWLKDQVPQKASHTAAEVYAQGEAQDLCGESGGSDGIVLRTFTRSP